MSDVVFGPETVVSTEPGLSGPWFALGLPPGLEGAGGRPVFGAPPMFVAEARVLEDSGEWSEWGESEPFSTLNLWQSGEYVTHVDVQIERIEGEGTLLQSYRDFGGFNWLKGVRVEPAGVDAAIGSGSIALIRQAGGDSLAPLVTLSSLNLDGETYAPALDFGRELFVRATIMLPGSEPEEEDWTPVIRGITDDVEWPRKTGDVTVPFRDFSGRLADTMMRTQERYGSEEGTDALEVMQAYVDAHMGAGQYTIGDLTTGDRFNVTAWTPSDVYVWEGLQQVALMWGGNELRQVEEAEGALLAVIEPDRTKDTPDYEIGPGTYIDCTAINTSGKYLRTIVRGRAVDKETGETISFQYPAEEDVGVDPLVLLYGPIFFQFDEEQAKGIDTADELEAMVMAIYSDLSTPPIPLEMETKYCPFARVGDYVRWSADTVLRDEPLDAAVLTLVHTFPSPGVGRTLWRCAGKPKGRYATYTHLGVEVAGIGKRPAIFNRVLTYDDETRKMTLTVDFNPQVARWRFFDKIGGTPVEGGIPNPKYAQGEYFPTQRQVSWSVYYGEHFVFIRALASDGVFVDSVVSLTVVNPTEGLTPEEIPGTPLLRRGPVVGDLQTVDFSWENTNEVSGIEFQVWGGETVADEEGAWIPLAAGTASYSANFGVPQHLKARLRYTEGVGLEGPPSNFSVEIFLL